MTARHSSTGRTIHSLECRRLLSAEMVIDLWPGAGNGMEDTPGHMVDVAGTLFFFARDEQGLGLWRTGSGPNPATKLKTFELPEDIPQAEMAAVGGTLFFAGMGPGQGNQLWKSDGTTGGTVMITELSGSLRDLTAANGTLFFVASDGDHGFEVWKSDGTAGGTQMVRDIMPGESADSEPADLTAVGRTLFFTANDGAHGRKLWRTDGSYGGTVMVQHLSPPDSQGPQQLIDVSGTLFFSDNGLWSSDGTARGTVRVASVAPDSPTIYTKRTSVNLNGELLFTAGFGLWKSDGTSAGTVLLRNFPSDDAFGDEGGPERLVIMDGKAYFTADDGVHGIELWKTDGTAAGTEMVGDLTPGDDSTFSPWSPPMVSCDGRLYFTGLRESDGTAEGTKLIGDDSGWWPGEEWFGLATVSGNAVYFAASDSLGHGTELWKLSRNPPPPIATLNQGALTVHGTAANDMVTIRQTESAVDVGLNGRLLSFASWKVSRIGVEPAAGNDVIRCDTLSAPVTVNGGTGNDHITGGNAADFLRGEGGRDTILGGRGNDRIEGNAGGDYLIGGEGHDAVWAGTGDDRLEGNAGKDTLYGQAGNDALFGGSGNDRLDGGDGNDNVSGQAGSDRMLGGNGHDRFFARDNTPDILDGGGGRDTAWIDLLLDRRSNMEMLSA